jgi:hypothetical protein
MGRARLRVVSGTGRAGSARITRLAVTDGRGPGKYPCAFGAAGTSLAEKTGPPNEKEKRS